jgi:hypothetical protein
MADILKSFTSNLIRFAAGERPSADKFNAMVSYFSRGMEDISRAIGDVYDVRPEGTLHSAKWNATNGERRNLDILNLARIIGPASNLNARMLNNSSTGKLVSETILLSTKEHELNYELNDGNTFILTPDNLTKVNSNNFTNENQYYYNRENNSIVFAKKTVEEITLSYFTIPSEYFGGLNYSEASFNVIPDPNVFTSTNADNDNAKLKIQPAAGEDNSYIINLPQVYAQQSGLADENAFKDVNLLNNKEYNYLSQMKLPEWMSENLIEGDAIPLNSIYLKDLTLGEAYLTADYFYVNQTSIKIKNASLCLGEGHNFVLVTVGTDITTSIDDLRLKWFRHTHDGTFGEERINIKNLAGIFVKEHVRLLFPDITFSKSSVEDNHLPMYLHRIGYTTDTSVNNGNNSMLGTLLMSRLEFDYQDADNQPIQSKDGVSQTLSFGGIGNDGAHIKRDSNSNLYIEGQENPKTGSTIAPNVQINSYNNIDSIAVDSIVNTAPNIFEKANYIYDDYEQNKKIRYENGSQELFTNQEYYYQNRESIDNTLDSNTINDAEHSLDYSSTFETTDLFDTKTDLTIWKDHSDIQIRKDIENTYTLQPRMLSDIPDYYRPNLNKINESSGSFEWLVYAGEVYKNGDESTKIGCPAIGYKNLNIKEYILPIEDDNFVLEYKDEIQLNSDENFDLPWLDNNDVEIEADENHTHVISFGEFQQLARNPDNSSQFELTTQTILREGTVGSTQNVGGYNFLDNDLRIFKYKSNKTRTFNYLDITNLINNNLKTTSYDEEEINRIELQTVRNVSQNSTDRYKFQPYGEVVIFERINSVDWGINTFQAHDYWKFRNGIFTHGYFSFEQEENDSNSTSENITTYRKYPKALINENFAIYVKNTSTNKIYWLKPYFTTYDDFNMSYEEFEDNGTNYRERPFGFGEDTDPYWTKENYDYTVLGNTIRFHIRPSIIGATSFNNFLINIAEYSFILVHSFENEQNTHQIHDSYIYIENNSSFTATNDSSWYTIQQSKNSLYNRESDSYSLNKDNIVRYTDFKGHIKNAQYRGIEYNVVWDRIDNKNYLLNITNDAELDDYNEQSRTTLGYYPIEPYLYSLPYGKEYIHRVHNQDNDPIKPKINRWKDYGENSQYITILRKQPDQIGFADNEVTRRFKIKALNDGEYNKEVIKFNFINFDFRSIRENIITTYVEDGEASFAEGSYKTITDKIESYIEWLNIPNFVISYTNSNEFKKRSENDFYFNGYYVDLENDSTYLNTNGSFTKPIFIKINNEDLGKQYKKDVNLSIYLKKYIALNFLNFALLPNQDYSVSKPRNFSSEKLIASFNNFKKVIFSSEYYYDSVSSTIIQSKFKDKWIDSKFDFNTSKDRTRVDLIPSLILLTDILNYVYSLNFIMDVKEIINKDSITLDIDFKITNLEVDKIRVNSDLDHVK